MEIIDAAVIGSIIGLILGGIILGISVKNNKTSIGVGGFFACVISGAILGLLAAVPVFIIFCFAIRPDKPQNE